LRTSICLELLELVSPSTQYRRGGRAVLLNYAHQKALGDAGVSGAVAHGANLLRILAPIDRQI